MVGSVNNTKNTPSPPQTSKVNVVQSTSSQQAGGQKKKRGKSKISSNQQESTKTQPKRKSKLPCMICMEDHYIKYFPHHEEVTKFMKGTFLPPVLTDPFPTQQQKMVAKFMLLRKEES
jgi:hypothetical protein